MGHADSLMDECDAIFVPSLANLGRFKSFCTSSRRCRSVRTPSATRRRASCPPRGGARVLHVDARRLHRDGHEIRCTKHDAKRAWKAARKASKNERKNKEHAFDAKLDELRRRKKKAEASSDEKPRSLHLGGRPSLRGERPLMGKGIVDALEELGATVLFAQDFDRERPSRRASNSPRPFPGCVNREPMGRFLPA
ncbi:MAG: acyl-CoA dehydratase activase-related protein [Slackia sp.]